MFNPFSYSQNNYYMTQTKENIKKEETSKVNRESTKIRVKILAKNNIKIRKSEEKRLKY